ERIVALKIPKHKKIKSFPLDNLEQILLYLTDKYEVFQISNKDESKTYLGNLNSVKGEYLILNTLTPKAAWIGKIKIKISEIRTIQFDNDYINSLKLLYKMTKA
ncbi:hypothetical protein ND863_19920, partial [Leptospira kanakyensis]|nr:hypothetical protein [Leptospira kanakyensis]